ncbi:uncharacterized protein LOC141659898 [Apium graveolens]|uniref:uncharacterized protein LOC141659898 n=1 Tax=Apium graveolens TaxID=4045 RepID=UPI003D7A888E
MCHLKTIQQRSKESIPEFIKRFPEPVNQLSNLEENKVVNIFRRNLHLVSYECYVKYLIYGEPQSLASIYTLASKFIKENDFLRSMKMNRRIHDDDESPERRSSYWKDKSFKVDRQSNYIQHSQGTPPRSGYSGPKKNDKKLKAKRDPKPEPKWTPLNRPWADILREVKRNLFYYPPKPLLASPENRARDKHCGYHKDHSHTTEKCFFFKLFIKDQIKKGIMNQYIQTKPNDKDKAPRGSKHVVNVIFRGTTSPPQGPDMDNDVIMIQPFEDEPIYFSYSDYEGLDPNHNQTLVVTLDFADNEVKRILVDNGSSANIIFEHTWSRMKLGHLCIDPCLKDPLYGFRNSMIPIRGVIYFPVTFETAPSRFCMS